MGWRDAARHTRDQILPLERLRRRNRQAVITRGVTFAGDVDAVVIGPGVHIQGPTSLFVTNGGGLEGASLVIGPRTYVGEFNTLRCAGAPISIGADCLISQQVALIGSNHQLAAGELIVEQVWQGSGIVIGNDVWIGAGAKILAGARLGDGAVVAANAVVRGVVEAGQIVGGVPAQPLGRR